MRYRTYGGVRGRSREAPPTRLATGLNGFEILDVTRGALRGTPLVNDLGKSFSITLVAQTRDAVRVTDTFTLALYAAPILVQGRIIDQSVFPNQPLTVQLESKELFSDPTASFLRLSLTSLNENPLPDWLTLKLVPTLLNTYPTGNGQAHGLAMLKKDMICVANFNAGLYVIDVSNSANPSLLGTYPNPSTGGYGWNVAVSGNTAFLADHFAGLHILNVSNLMNPQQLSSYPSIPNGPGVSLDWTLDVLVSGNIVYLADYGGGLKILDISNLNNPTLLSTYFIGLVIDVAVSGNTVFLADYNGGLHILDATDLRQPRLISNYSRSFISVATWGNTLFALSTNLLQILDVSNLTNPKVLSTYPSISHAANKVIPISQDIVLMADYNAGLQILDVGNVTHPYQLGSSSSGIGQVLDAVVSEDRLFVADGVAGLQILDMNTWEMELTPTYSAVGNYHFYLTAINSLGGSTSKAFTIRVEGSPQLHIPLLPQYAKVGQTFYYIAPPNTFIDPNFDPLVFSTSTLPTWLSFDSKSASFTGTPGAADMGVFPIQLMATDPLGGTVQGYFNLTIAYAPIVNQPLTQALNVIQGRYFTFSVPVNTFYSYGVPLSYALRSSDSTGLLPAWLHFHPENATLFGTPIGAGAMTLFVIATDAANHQVSTPLSVIVNLNTPPHANQPISTQTAQVGQLFHFFVPPTTFEDPDGDPLTYSASLIGGAPFPDWLTFDPETGSFKGTPGGQDTDAFSARTLTIVVTAQDRDRATATTLFNLNVDGTSNIALAIQIGGSILSALGFVWGIWRNRTHISNRVRYPHYQKAEQSITVGEPCFLPLTTPSEEIGSIKAKTPHRFSKGCGRFLDFHRFFKHPMNYLKLPYDALPSGESLPHWMKYDEINNRLYSDMRVPDTRYSTLNIRVKDRSGAATEQFTLKVRGTTLGSSADQSNARSLQSLGIHARIQKEQDHRVIEMSELSGEDLQEQTSNNRALP